MRRALIAVQAADPRVARRASTDNNNIIPTFTSVAAFSILNTKKFRAMLFGRPCFLIGRPHLKRVKRH